MGEEPVSGGIGGGFHVYPCDGRTDYPAMSLQYPMLEDLIYEGQTITLLGEAYDIINQPPDGPITMHFYVDDVYVGSDSTQPSTAQWTATAGRHIVRADGNGARQSGGIIVLEADTDAYPEGSPHVMPGIINATNYDNGGPGAGYYDTDEGNNGNGPRQDEDVYTGLENDIASVGWISAGEWLNFTATAAQERTYTFEFSVASQVGGSSFHLEIDGEDVTGPISVPATGGWNVYTQVVVPDIFITEGLHTLRIAVDQGPFNISDIRTTYTENEYCGAPFDDGSLGNFTVFI